MWRRFLSRVGEGHSWHPVGGDQGGCSTPCSAADARSRVASADVRSGRLRTPCPGRSPRQPCLCFVPAPSRYPESPAPKELGCPRYSSRGGGAGWRAAGGAAAGPQPAASYVVSPWAMVRSVACRNGRGCERNISKTVRGVSQLPSCSLGSALPGAPGPLLGTVETRLQDTCRATGRLAAFPIAAGLMDSSS